MRACMPISIGAAAATCGAPGAGWGCGGRGAIVARMGYPERCAWELAWARYAPGARGSVTQAREVFDGWVLVSCDALMEREVGG